MAAYQLPLSEVVNISVSASPTGVNAYNTSNLALFTNDTPGGAFPGAGYALYLNAAAVGIDFGTGSATYAMAVAVFSQNPNILANGGYLVIIALQASETLAAAISRTQGLVQYFGIMSNTIESQVDMLAAAAVIQTLNAVGFFAQTASASVVSGGSLDLLRTGLFTQSRGLLYGVSTSTALVMQAAYASRGLSTIFSGSNTTQNMNLKQLVGVQPDTTMTTTIFANAQLAGADIYASLQGFPGVLSSGANDWFDNVYNLQWFVGALQVSGFNYLASASTKIPQTEAGMDGLKSAYQAVCQQAVRNQYCAPGSWNSPTTFGNQAQLIANVAQIGYYIYSSPIATQLQVDRVARKAPLVQLAVKLAGAINTSTVIVNVNP